MRHLVAVLVLLLAPAACRSSSDDATGRPAPGAGASPTATPRPVHSPAPGMPYEGDWAQVSGTSPEGPIRVDPDFRITLALSGRRANGRSTCNGYGGRFAIDGAAYHQLTLGADQAGCVSESLAAAETRYLSALYAVEEVQADESTLRLTGPQTELVFERVPEIEVDAIVDRISVSGDHTLRLSSDRTFRVTYGCDVLKGTWGVMAGRIYMPEARLTRDCPDDRGGEGVAIDVTSGDFTASVDGDRLSISWGGRSVVYRERR